MIGLDALGFPLLPLPAVGLDVMLLPVTHAQFDFVRIVVHMPASRETLVR